MLDQLVSRCSRLSLLVTSRRSFYRGRFSAGHVTYRVPDLRQSADQLFLQVTRNYHTHHNIRYSGSWYLQGYNYTRTRFGVWSCNGVYVHFVNCSLYIWLLWALLHILRAMPLETAGGLPIPITLCVQAMAMMLLFESIVWKHSALPAISSRGHCNIGCEQFKLRLVTNNGSLCKRYATSGMLSGIGGNSVQWCYTMLCFGYKHFVINNTGRR